MQKIVGLVGLRGSGKDTAAQFLVEKGWTRLAFADALYIEAAEAYGVTVGFLQRRETKETPLPELALVRCKDNAFVGCVLGHDASAPDTVSALLEQPRSPREILQLWGTEYRRQLYSDDYWRAQVAAVVRAHPEKNFVITDVRFPDEGKLVEDMPGGQLARICRPGLSGGTDKALQHVSEQAMLNYPIALAFINDEGPAGLDRFQRAVLSAFA